MRVLCMQSPLPLAGEAAPAARVRVALGSAREPDPPPSPVALRAPTSPASGRGAYHCPRSATIPALFFCAAQAQWPFPAKEAPMSAVPISSAAPSQAASGSWVVLKFGGTSVSTRARWDKIAAIAQGWRARGKRVLIVVSALSGITDKLKAICEAHGDLQQRNTLRDEIVARHRAMFAELGLSDHAPMHYWLERLAALVANVRAEAATLPWQAEVL